MWNNKILAVTQSCQSFRGPNNHVTAKIKCTTQNSTSNQLNKQTSSSATIKK